MAEAKPLVGIVLGSDSDLPAVQEAAAVLEELEIPFELTIASAHRTPERVREYAASAEERGLVVIIAAAGGAAHLPGVVAAQTLLPVIGLPVPTASLGGLDSLLSMVQMPPGVPVATVGIGAARNAGLLAAQVVAESRPEVKERLRRLRTQMAERVEEKARALERKGWSAYLAELKHQQGGGR
ncbi:MAG: 5-(carboxyamino)imidazole ribonucleotide mutase [Bacillota bacterium]|nr:5-(carboxyamino)imidazole ribonucleotide mutase [Bacillota bacterium]